MKRLALILGLGALMAPGAVLAAPAQESSWTRGCQSGQTTKNLVGGAYACYSSTSAGLEPSSPILYVGDCDNVDVFMWDDPDGDGASICTVTWAIQGCPPGGSALASDALKNAACNTLTGVANLNGDDVRGNLAAEYIRVVGQGAGANPTQCQILVKCAEGAQQ